MTMETNCPLCGRRTIDPVPVRERLRCVECDALVKAAPALLQPLQPSEGGSCSDGRQRPWELGDRAEIT